MGSSQERGPHFSTRLHSKESVTSTDSQAMSTSVQELGQSKRKGCLAETLKTESEVSLLYEYEKFKGKGKEESQLYSTSRESA